MTDKSNSEHNESALPQKRPSLWTWPLVAFVPFPDSCGAANNDVQIDGELDLHRLLNRQFCRLRSI
jgi:hypothetical protein